MINLIFHDLPTMLAVAILIQTIVTVLVMIGILKYNKMYLRLLTIMHKDRYKRIPTAVPLHSILSLHYRLDLPQGAPGVIISDIAENFIELTKLLSHKRVAVTLELTIFKSDSAGLLSYVLGAAILFKKSGFVYEIILHNFNTLSSIDIMHKLNIRVKGDNHGTETSN